MHNRRAKARVRRALSARHGAFPHREPRKREKITPVMQANFAFLKPYLKHQACFPDLHDVQMLLTVIDVGKQSWHLVLDGILPPVKA